MSGHLTTSPSSPEGSVTKQEVMVVDDDRYILIAVKTVLNEAGFSTDMVEDGRTCISHLKQGFTGIILLDIMMPDMDGWDTIKAISDEGLIDNVLIAMLTAKSDPDNKMIGLQDYVFDYIRKPFDPEELVSKVTLYSKYLNGKS